MARRPDSLPVLILLLALAWPARSADGAAQGGSSPPRETFRGSTQVTLVELVVEVRDERGATPAVLSPADFEVVEDGVARPVVAVERLAGGGTTGSAAAAASRAAAAAPAQRTWEVTLYFDLMLSGGRSVRRTAEALAAQAGRLTSLGPVRLVVAGPEPEEVLAATRSARLVEAALTHLARDGAGRDALKNLRREFVRNLQLKGALDARNLPQELPTGSLPGEAPGPAPFAELKGANFGQEQLIRSALREERMLLRRQQDRLLGWAAEDLTAGPKTLLLVSDGFDLDPMEFYASSLSDPTLIASLAGEAHQQNAAAGFDDLVQALAARGWVTVNVAPGGLEPATTMAAETTGRGRMGEIMAGSEDAVAQLPSSLVLHPLQPLNVLAEATGGETLTGVREIPAALGRLADRVVVSYQVERPADGSTHRVEVRARRPGLTVKAPRWSSSPAPAAAASARARRLLAGDVERGDLTLLAVVALQEAEGEDAARRSAVLQARLELGADAGLAADRGSAPRDLRVTTAVSFAEGTPFVRHETAQGQRLGGLDAWTYTLPLSLPAGFERVAVVVEDLATGAWGGALAGKITGPLPTAGGRDESSAEVREGVYDLPENLLPERKAVLLLAPAGDVLTGRTRFETLVTRADVERVEFLLDGRRVETRGRAPYEASLDLGAVPARHTVEVVALDAEGTELGRDALTVNAGAGVFRVRLIEPGPTAGGATPRVGAVDVEAEVALRPDDRLDRVEIAWNDEVVATLFEPPFRARAWVPPDAPVGYLTVTAWLADGSTAEDVLFLNALDVPQERVEVRLVELPTVVTDPTGRPIEGLAEEDFRLLDAGSPVAIDAVRDGSDLPLTLGLLIDSSASMADDLRRVQTAAIDFLFTTLGEQDSAFLVDFDSEPRLAHPLTSDRSAIGAEIARLRAGGYTALYDALVFSLVQMQPVRGRRGVVVLSDGVGREERVGYATALAIAQRVGVPLYLVILDRDGSERARGDGLEKLARAVGGRVFYVPDLDQVGDAYCTIRQELRSQYLVTYYPPGPGPGGRGDDWRPLTLETLRPGLTARTRAGYYP
ncbi:MAG TPA: VWA domain-containing protein [Thermoanaerobaculia bacterium]|nr:VWA domain-containing protein [Thermoanaerobaculia bacterium]